MAGPGLYVWGGGSRRAARERSEAGAVLVAWPGSDPRPLERDSLPFRALVDVIGARGCEASVAAERGFARVWARLPLRDGRSFRDLVSWRGESLLWTCESYLRHATAGPRCAGIAETCLRLLEATDPTEVDAGGLAPPDVLLLSRAAVARGVLFHGDAGRSVKSIPPAASTAGEGGRGGLLARFGRRGTDATVAGMPLVAVHDDGPGASVLDALLEAVRDADGRGAAVVPLDALARHETARARDAIAGAERSFRETLASLRGTPGLAASYAQRGVGFAELAALDLEAVLLGHLPRAVRIVERALDFLAAARPALALVAVEDRDLRRAVGLAAGAAGVPWAAVAAAAWADERVDAGPQPVARLEPAEDGSLDDAAARLRAAARGSVWPER